jgi:ADP-ribose pyrophosphatase YjhB (NUDIX family)
VTKSRIRPLAICVFRHAGRILVFEGYDRVKGQLFCRPLGGGIEFGERSADAVAREIREELRAEVTDLRLLGVLENVFTYEGKPGHEVVFVYDARFADTSLYEQEVLIAHEGDDPFRAVWKSLSEFGSGGPPLYPDGLLELLAGQ